MASSGTTLLPRSYKFNKSHLIVMSNSMRGTREGQWRCAHLSKGLNNNKIGEGYSMGPHLVPAAIQQGATWLVAPACTSYAISWSVHLRSYCHTAYSSRRKCPAQALKDFQCCHISSKPSGGTAALTQFLVVWSERAADTCKLSSAGRQGKMGHL